MGKLVLFSKFFADRGADDLIALAGALGVDGYDLCVRPGHPVNPDNVGTALVKIGAKVVKHSRHVIFQLAEVAVPRELFAAILARIQRLAPVPT